MNLRTTLGLSREGSLEEGTPSEVAEKKRRAIDEALRPKRLEWHAATTCGRRSRTTSFLAGVAISSALKLTRSTSRRVASSLRRTR